MVAFGAGLVSFVSPCVLPLVPAYVGNLAGVSLESDATANVRLISVIHALLFVAGFTTTFVLFWTSIGLIGYLVPNYLPYIRLAGGALLILIGLNVMGLLRIPFLYRELSVPFNLKGRTSYPRSFLLGLLFAAGWTPCIGPVLAGIIGLASLRDTVWQGGYLLLVYSIGLGTPFILTALAITPITRLFKRIGKHQRALSIVTGLFIVLVGVLLITNEFSRIPRYFSWGAV
jgi:cytochrome c-type biogenesis protein